MRGACKRPDAIARSQEVAQLPEAEGIRHAVIDLNPHTVRAGVAGGGQFIFGDAGRPEVLEVAGLAGAAVLALTIPDEPATLRACAAARHLAPEIFIVARVTSASRRPAALAAGADLVIADELAAAKVVADAIRGRCPMECPSESQ
jgi:monovalent cation:H+ antiporter-2, CPA2 family